MGKVKLLAGVVALISLVGCATTGQLGWSPEQRATIKTRIYGYESTKVFNSVLEVFDDVGIPVETIDRESGRIISIQNVSFFLGLGKGTAKYFVDIKPLNNNSTKVKLHISFKGMMYSTSITGYPYGVGDEMVKEDDYQRFFRKLDIKLKKQ